MYIIMCKTRFCYFNCEHIFDLFISDVLWPQAEANNPNPSFVKYEDTVRDDQTVR